jgi:hypothetical protein
MSSFPVTGRGFAETLPLSGGIEGPFEGDVISFSYSIVGKLAKDFYGGRGP